MISKRNVGNEMPICKDYGRVGLLDWRDFERHIDNPAFETEHNFAFLQFNALSVEIQFVLH
jgi:hypothetical protein